MSWDGTAGSYPLEHAAHGKSNRRSLGTVSPPERTSLKSKTAAEQRITGRRKILTPKKPGRIAALARQRYKLITTINLAGLNYFIMLAQHTFYWVVLRTGSKQETFTYTPTRVQR